MLSKNILNGFKNGGNPLVATVSWALLNMIKLKVFKLMECIFRVVEKSGNKNF